MNGMYTGAGGRFTGFMRAHWALDLNNYSDAKAARSLPNQLRLLQVLAVHQPGIELTWRLEATKERKGSDSIEAKIFLVCRSSFHDKDPEGAVVRGAVLELENYASVALAGSYGFGRTRRPEFNQQRFVRHLVPVDYRKILPAKEDWSILIDLLRHRGTPLTIDISCASPPQSRVPDDTTVFLQEDGTKPILDFDAGYAYLASLPASEKPRSRVALSLSVGAAHRIDDSLLHLIGQCVLGTPVKLLTAATMKATDPPCYAPEVALRAWHAPYGALQGRGLMIRPPRVPAFRDLSGVDGACLGTTNVQGPDWDRESEVRISEDERERHLYIVGKTGSGKTNLLKQIAEQDIRAGRGVAVITPHADLVEYLLDRVGDRADEVVLLDFGDPDFVPILNPLTLDVDEMSANQRMLDLIDLIAKRTYNQFAGPVFTDFVRLAIETVAELSPMTGTYPSMAVAVELVKSETLQRWAQEQLKQRGSRLAEEWGRYLSSRDERHETARWVSAKFSDLGEGSALRSITTQLAPSPLSIRSIFNDGRILLVRIPETNMAASSASLIGSVIFSRLFAEAQRAGLDDRRAFYVHVDEFQRFVTSDLEELIAEARKFHLGLALAHQNLRQLETYSVYEGGTNGRLAEAIFANVGTLIAMKTAGADVKRFADELDLDEQVIRSVSRGYAVMRTSHDGEDVKCSIRIPLVTSEPDRPARELIRRRMVDEGFWVARADHQEAVAASLAALDREAARPRSTRSRARSGSDEAETGPLKPAQTVASSFAERLRAERQRKADATRVPPQVDEQKEGAHGR